MSLSEYVSGQVWLQQYPIHFAGCDFNARMTVIRVSDTALMIHIENFIDRTPNVNWMLKLWWKAVVHMWEKPKPAPEYQMGWKDKTAARKLLRQILAWDFDRITMAHGDLIETEARERAMDAWKRPLNAS